MIISVSVSLSAWCCSDSRRPAEHPRKSACWLPPFPPLFLWVPGVIVTYSDLDAPPVIGAVGVFTATHPGYLRVFAWSLASRIGLLLAVPWRGVPLQAPTLATWQAQRQPFLCPPLRGSLSPGDQGERLSFLTQSGFPARKQHPARCVQLLLGDFKELHPPPVGAWFADVWSIPPGLGPVPKH